MELYNIGKMEEERNLILKFCEDQRIYLEDLRRKMESTHWNDARRDELVEQMNEFSRLLAGVLSILYRIDNKKVNYFDDLIPLLKEYKKTASAFDQI
jgi:hypothetical protein